MVEWFKAAVLKTAVAQVTEGSNPSFSANYLRQESDLNRSLFYFELSPVFVTSLMQKTEKAAAKP